MPNTLESPLVTFALVAYNQEKYICEAIEGAFSQTYSPLEIIISDDCSTDDTFEIIQAMVNSYTGNHKVILNRNVTNQGIGQHINTVMEMSNGEFIVVAAGDDISLPHRTETLTKAWLLSNKNAMSLYSAYIEINEDGSIRGDIKQCKKDFTTIEESIRKNYCVLGAAHAWSKEVFDIFGPLRCDLIHEDAAITFRSMLLGCIAYIDEPLIKYRINVGVSKNYGTRGNIQEELYGSGAVYANRVYIDYLQKTHDLETFNADKSLLQLCNRRLQEQKLLMLLAKKTNNKPKLFLSALANGAGFWFSIVQLLRYSSPCLIILKRKLVTFLTWC